MRKLDDNRLEMEHSVAGSAYRWKLSQQLAQLPGRGRIKQNDEPIQQAMADRPMFEGVGRKSANQKYPTFAAACQIAENEQSFRVLKLSVLGSLPRTEVAARLVRSESCRPLE